MQPRYTSIVAPLPSTVPFVGPEAQERARGVVFKARIGANESAFGPSPKAIAAMRTGAAAEMLDVLRSRELRSEGGAGAGTGAVIS